MLPKHKANTEAMDDEGYTPLHLTSLKGNVEIVNTLLAHGPNSGSSCSFEDHHSSFMGGILEKLDNRTVYGDNDSQSRSADAMAKLIVNFCIKSCEQKPKSELNMSIGQMLSNYINMIVEVRRSCSVPQSRDGRRETAFTNSHGSSDGFTNAQNVSR
ncbi:hypothetical protein F66182_2741 [Fusarium sp. NRRL 66182]|nr:hypothetical protein F66182_2741 [Fusarium sp. NRRL 66182]